MIRDLMDKLHIQDSIEGGNAPADKENPAEQPAPSPAKAPAQNVPIQPPQNTTPKEPVRQAPASAQKIQPTSADKPASNVPPVPKPRLNLDDINLLRGGDQMNDGIIIDLGDGISLNVPIKRRMTLHEFLRVAEKVKALEMLAEDEYHKQRY